MKEKFNNFLIYTGAPNRDNAPRILHEGRHIDTAIQEVLINEVSPMELEDLHVRTDLLTDSTYYYHIIQRK